MIPFIAHWGFEMGGSACWACARAKCKCRWHRYGGDALLTAFLTLVLLRVVG